MRALPAKAKQHFAWGTISLALGFVAVFMGWDWKAMVLGFGFGAILFGLAIWTIQSDRRIEDLKRQVEELDL